MDVSLLVPLFGSVHRHLSIIYNKNVGSVLRIVYTRDCTLKLCAIMIKNKKFHQTYKVGKGC